MSVQTENTGKTENLEMREKKELICIVCPNGCRLSAERSVNEPDAEDVIIVTGNRCPKGKDFAITELTAPMRTISSTAATDFSEYPVVPVRVSGDIPKGRIFDVMKEINSLVITEPVSRGEAVIRNVLGLGVDVIVTSDVLRELCGAENQKQ